MKIDLISLGDLSHDTFLRDYWQKRPLLIRQALPGFESPITPDELAGLACEEGVESSLIMEQKVGAEKPWEVKHGVFTEDDFATLPETHWTLLVHEMNRHVPEIGDILDKFQFIPQWRIDDLMVSYAPLNGSVGAHTDNYDVFLIQAYGVRRWQISHERQPLIPDIDIKVMQSFTAEESWDLHPGDILYLPPNVAHYGVAQGDCMTFSVGFLAPSHTDLLNDYVHHFTQHLEDEQRYADPDLCLQDHAGQISPQALAKIQNLVQSMPTDTASINQWFGQFISESRIGTRYECPEPSFEVETWLAEFAELGNLRREARILFIDDESGVTLFVEGQAIAVSTENAETIALLTEQREFSYTALSAYFNDELLAILLDLTNKGYFYFYESDESAC